MKPLDTLYQDNKTERFFLKKEHEIYHQILPTIETQYAIDMTQLVYFGTRCNIAKFQLKTQTQNQYLLSIYNTHLPENGWNRLAAVQSQLMWQNTLNQNTNLRTQIPILNQQREKITRLPIINAHHETIKCTLLTWLEGEVRDETPETAQQMGIAAGHLHQYASQWSYPPKFTRPVQDIHWLTNIGHDLEQPHLDGRLSQEQYNHIQAAITKTVSLLKSIPQTPETFGIIHGDLCISQFIHHQNQIGVIDFDNCALGYYLFDLGWALHNKTPDYKRSYLIGYESVRPLSKNDKHILEAFMVISTLWPWSWVAQKPKMTFNNATTFFEHDCIPFLKSESILFAQTGDES